MPLIARLLLIAALPAILGAAPAPQTLPGYLAEIAAAFPDPDRFRALAGSTIFDDIPTERRAPFGTPRIVRTTRDGRSAVVLLSATTRSDGSGERTYTSSLWSGLYPATLANGHWQLGTRFPLDLNRIERQRIDLAITPASGITIHDTLTLDVADTAGVPILLNATARIAAAAIDGKPARFDFQNGLLWVDMRKGRHTLRLDYALAPEAVETGNSAAFAPEAGHLRNQYFWHPFFGFGTERGRAAFTVSATIPAQYQLALDIPQIDRVSGAVRTVTGATASAEALTFAYDRDWKPTGMTAGGVALALIATPNFKPAPEAISATFARTMRVLGARFGRPGLDQIKIVQSRRRPGNGWHFFSNQAIFTGPSGGDPARPTGFPIRQFLGHEVAHLWTHPTGWARNFLGEGWATYAESLIAADESGPDAAHRFWQDQARLLLASPGAMAATLQTDRTNSGVSYSKGAWALRMVEALVGPAAFDRAITAFAAAPATHSDYGDFLAGFGADRPRVERFLAPWISQAGLPALAVRAEAGRIAITQAGAPYWLPNLAVHIVLADGTESLSHVDLDGAEASIALPPGRTVTRVDIDPFEDVLLERRLFPITAGPAPKAGVAPAAALAERRRKR